jgi:enamine deaminase RidA (YjgF/YER057c/UK114 family)
MTRRSISIDGLSHQASLPVATRIGPLLVSSVIASFDPGTRSVPPSLDAQIANLFLHVGKMLAAAGGDWRHVAKMEFWMPDPVAARALLEAPWVEKFPDATSRPARHTHRSDGPNASASFMAWIGE